MKQIFLFTLLYLSTILLLSSYGEDDDPLCTQLTWYEDADGDGLGNPAISQSSCDQPDGFVTDNSDTENSGYTFVVQNVDASLFLLDDANLTIITF